MLNIRPRSLSVFSLAFILIFTFAAAAAVAAAQNKEPVKPKKTAKKTSVSRQGRTAPKLKPAAASVVKPAVKKETAHKTDDAPATAAKTEVKEKTAGGRLKTEVGEAKEEAPAAHTQTETQEAAAKTEAKEKPAAEKTETKEKSFSPTASPTAKKIASKKKSDPPTIGTAAPAATAAKKVEAKEEPAAAPVTTAKKAAAKEKTAAAPVTTAKKAEPKEKPAAAVSTAKKAEAKEKTAAVITAKKAETKKKIVPAVTAAAPAKKVEPKKKTAAAAAAATATAAAAAAAASPGPVKVWLPRVTADKVRADINGATVADVPSEESGDGTMDWLFAANQPKEIEILKTQQKGDELTVEARFSAKKAKPNWDGSIDRLRGTARLYYARGKGKWELKRVDNISLRHSDTGMDNPLPGPIQAYPAPQTAAISVVSAPPFSIISNGSAVDIAAGNYRSFSFRVEDKAVVSGRFQAQGGRQNDIEAYILDQDGFLNWSNGHGAPAYYNSGRLTVGTIETPLDAGTYYLVFNNRYARADNKLVEASVQLRADTASPARLNKAADTYIDAGTGAGTINIVRRTYLPGVPPAPAYIRPPEKVEAPETPEKVAKQDTNTPAATTRQAVKPQINIAGYESDAILSDTFNVEGRKHHAIQFAVKTGGGTVRGSFSVAGANIEGSDPNIDAYIMTASEYYRWSNYHEAVLDYSSGRVARGRIDRKLGPGDYYLVFSNHFSTRGSKTVEAELHIEYLPR